MLMLPHREAFDFDPLDPGYPAVKAFHGPPFYNGRY